MHCTETVKANEKQNHFLNSRAGSAVVYLKLYENITKRLKSIAESWNFNLIIIVVHYGCELHCSVYNTSTIHSIELNKIYKVRFSAAAILW